MEVQVLYGRSLAQWYVGVGSARCPSLGSYAFMAENKLNVCQMFFFLNRKGGHHA